MEEKSVCSLKLVKDVARNEVQQLMNEGGAPFLKVIWWNLVLIGSSKFKSEITQVNQHPFMGSESIRLYSLM